MIALRAATAADIPVMFEIRLAVRENAVTLAALAAGGITQPAVARLLATTGAGWMVAEDAGFAMADAVDGNIFALFIRPGQEGRGFGRALLGKAEAWLAGHGWRQAWLLTGANRRLRAQGFYRAQGWRPAGRAPRGEQRFVRNLGP